MSWYAYGNSDATTGTRQNFGPKTTFTYTASASAPTVSTNTSATSITSSGATCGGNLTSTGGASTERGICYMQGTSGTPTISNSTESAGSTASTGTFSVNLTGLSAGTTYRYRAYASNTAGISYGSTYSFTTSSPPSISTNTVSSITYNSASSGGEDISGSNITEKGLVWRTSSGVTTGNYNASGVNGGKSSNGTGTSDFTQTMTGLSPGVTYYVKAYATNSGGTSYGAERSFLTTAANTYTRLAYDSGTDGNGSEDAENLFDQSTSTKWCVTSFSSANVIFHSAELIKPVGYRMATANDNYSNHGRSPKTWILYGGTSASGSWTPIATVSNNYYMRDVNYTYYTFGTDVSNTAYNYFKLEITGISSGAVMQISEFDFLVPSYNITIGSHTGGSLSTSPSGSAIPGETVTVTATPNSGYQLTALTYNDGSDHSISISSTPYTFTMPSADVTVSATFSQVDYTITTNIALGQGTLTTSPSSSAISGTTVTVTATPASGYQLTALTYTPAGGSAVNILSTKQFSMPASNVTVTATFSTTPTVTTGNVGTPTTSSVSITANNVSSDGGASVTARGVYCGTSANPTSGGGASGSGTGNYDVSLSDLTSNTLYHVRAYATNTVGTGYGSDKTFTTLAVVSTPTSASVTSSSATFSSSVTAGGNATITERGVYWSTSSTAPTSSTTLNSSNSKAASTAATGSYSVTPTSFTTGTTYYVWAYVRNAGGINFSSSYSTITTLTRHTVTYDKNHSGASGTMTDSNSPYDAGSTVTVLANSFTAPTNYIFGIWNTAADGSGTSYTAGSTFTITANTTLYAQWAPIRIANATQWYEFSAVVNDGFTYSGQTVYLDADITVTTSAPVGTSSKPFQGTFDGNGHVVNYTHSANVDHKGLFGYVSGSGNIKNVIVNATLSGNSTSVGAVVGTFASSGTISNVGASGTISSLATKMGGLVGEMTDGTIHSSYAVAALTGSATNKGGLVGQNAGTLYNSYSNATYSGTGTTGGLVGANSGIVENCYAAGIASGVSALAGSNANTIQYCYADAVGDGYVGTSGTAPTGCGTYGAVQSSIKDLDYMYRDNLITKSTNTYVGEYDAIADGINVYVNRHTPVWNGLVSALNQWVTANKTSGANISTLSSWYRPLTTNINGDLPVLGFGDHTTLGAASDSPKVLKYGTMDDLLTTYSGGTASIFHYGKATGVTHVPTTNVKVYIQEDAVLLQDESKAAGDFINATVGVTFDNSDRGAHAYDYWGNKLNYDWHLLSTPLSDLKTGAVHSSYPTGSLPDSQVDITDIDGYFPDGLITSGNPAVGGSIKWDFYTYYEPEYHWINLKRSKYNHIHQDGGAPIHYDQNDQDTDGESAKYIPGKGYEMAISQDTYMNATGTLNKGNVEITLTNSEPDDINYAKGWNLVGNPYQAYLNISLIGKESIYTYDADQGTFVPYTTSASENPEIVSRYIHPHQAFFVQASSNNEELRFTQSMATTDTESGSYFRDDKVNYPLVNLFAEDGAGHRDLTVIEFHRPELGGAPKLDYMRTSPFSLAAYYSGRSYGILFATDDIERVPVHFKPGNGGLITLTWITHNGEFSMLNLIDNKLGVEHDMLADNTYVFEASPDDYSSRFYITYECSGTGIDENDDDGASTGSATFAYINNGNIVIDVGSSHGASLQIIDVLGRVMYSTVCTDDVHTVSTNGLAKGVYLIRLVNNKVVRTQKIVVK